MYENPAHIRKNILTGSEARNLGLVISKNDHYHGLGKDLYIKAIDSLDNPRVIFKRTNVNEYLILTAVKDGNNKNILIPIEIETTTNINKIKIDINRVKTVYGYDISNPDLNEYIKYNINQNQFQKIYEQKKERGTGNSTVASSFSTNNVPQTNTNVNTSSIKHSMQNNQNDAWQEYIEANFKSEGARTFVESLLVSKDNKQTPLLEYLDELVTKKIENQKVENVETKEVTKERHDKYARQLERLNQKYNKKKAELDKVQKKYDDITKLFQLKY